MPTAIIYVASPKNRDFYAGLCQGVTDAICTVLNRPSHFVHAHVIESPCANDFGNGNIVAEVFAHGGRSQEEQQAIGQKFIDSAVALGVSADNIFCRFCDNPSGAILTQGVVRWAANDPRAPK